MRRYFSFLFALALAASAAAAYADPPGRVGRVNHASGAVSFAPAEAPDQWAQVPLNRPLTAGDRLWADANSRAELHVGSTALRMGAQTSVDILNLDDDTIQLRLAQGSLTTRVRSIDAGERIEIATPSGAVLLTQPGSYRVSVDPQSDSARVLVNYGQAQVVTPTQTLTVPSSQALWFANGAPPQFEVVTAASADALDRWSAERDRREDRVASTRYVSPHMTGYEDLDQHGAWRTYPEYGAVWVPARVAPGWAPYRHGHWAWISPWGWTWIDDAPWGFAPFHYGRWVWVHDHWAWAPGTYVRRPVYAPALVAFVGGSHFSVSVSSGPAVGWFPLGWRDPYIPWYRASHRHMHNVNVTHVTNVTNITNIYNSPAAAANVNYRYRNNPQAVTVVPRQAFVSSQPVARSAVQVEPAALARAEVVHAKPAAEPTRASFAHERRGQQPPANASSREVVAVTAPAKPATQASLAPQTTTQAAAPAAAQQPRAEHEPRVRVIGRERAEARAAEKTEKAAERREERAEKAAEKAAPQPAQPAAQTAAPAPAASPLPPAPKAQAPAAAAPASPPPAKDARDDRDRKGPPAQRAEEKRAPEQAGRPAERVARPTEPVARPPEPVARPTEPVARPPEPVARPTEPVARPPEPVARPREQVARPPEQMERPQPDRERERGELERVRDERQRERAQERERERAAEPRRQQAIARPEAPRAQPPQAVQRAEPPQRPQRFEPPQPVQRAEPPRPQPLPPAQRAEPPRPQAQPPVQRAEPPRPQPHPPVQRAEAPRPQAPQAAPRAERPKPQAEAPRPQGEPQQHERHRAERRPEK